MASKGPCLTCSAGTGRTYRPSCRPFISSSPWSSSFRYRAEERPRGRAAASAQFEMFLSRCSKSKHCPLGVCARACVRALCMWPLHFYLHIKAAAVGKCFHCSANWFWEHGGQSAAQHIHLSGVFFSSLFSFYVCMTPIVSPCPMSDKHSSRLSEARAAAAATSDFAQYALQINTGRVMLTKRLWVTFLSCAPTFSCNVAGKFLNFEQSKACGPHSVTHPKLFQENCSRWKNKQVFFSSFLFFSPILKYELPCSVLVFIHYWTIPPACDVTVISLTHTHLC